MGEGLPHQGSQVALAQVVPASMRPWTWEPYMAEGGDLAGWLVSKVACRDTVAAAFGGWHPFLERTVSPACLVMAVPRHTQASAPGGGQRCSPGLQRPFSPPSSYALFPAPVMR